MEFEFFYEEDEYRQELNPTLKEGSSGDYVIILQEKLKILDYYLASITGNFDAYTKEAVMNFQEDNDLVPDGIVNNETWQTLYELTDNPEVISNTKQSRPTLKLGSTGPYVIELQTILQNLLYYNGPINGNFDTATQTAVKSFQSNNKLTADGIVGRNTWSALATLYSPLAICNEDNVENNVYTVQSGDTLYSIARRFNTTVDEIKRLNNLTSDILSIGQQLIIPTTGSSGSNNQIYTVQSGDTLYSIARRFNTTVDEIKRLNNLTSDILSIGQQLIIPATGSSGSNNQIYTVQSGDTLYSIARRFNTTVDAIKRLNNLTSDILSIGQQLIIPTTSSSGSGNQIYTVQSGDTLYSIARRFNTTVSDIIRLNNLTSDILSIGQQLIIPT